MGKKPKTKSVPQLNPEYEFQVLFADADELATSVEDLRKATTIEEVERLIDEIRGASREIYTAAVSWEPSDITGETT